MEKLELPFNVIEMTEENKKDFVDKINDGDIEFMLEVKDNKGELLGFQPMLSLYFRDKLVKDKLCYLAYLNDKLHCSKFSKRKRILEEIKKCIKSIEYFYKYKCYFITDIDDIDDELRRLNSYTKEEMLLSFESKDSKIY